MRTFSYATAILAGVLSQLCLADDQKAAPVTNDLTNYQGDRVSFNDDLIVTIQRPDGTGAGTVCLPAHVLLRGGIGYTVPASADGKTPSETGTLFRLLKPQKLSGGRGDSALKGLVKALTGTPHVQECAEKLLPDPKPTFDYTVLTPNAELRVSKETLDRSPPNRYGLTYGLLAVPFKYHLTGAKEFTGSATVGPYLGYRTQNSGYGYGISYITFLGASTISVAQTVNGESKSQNLAGFSYGAGAVATIKGNFQLGGVLGFDRVSKDAGYQYNGKPWLALELGYSFLQ